MRVSLAEGALHLKDAEAVATYIIPWHERVLDVQRVELVRLSCCEVVRLPSHRQVLPPSSCHSDWVALVFTVICSSLATREMRQNCCIRLIVGARHGDGFIIAYMIFNI